MVELTEFLLARIAEDEADALGDHWQVDPDDFEQVVRVVDGDFVASTLGADRARHIARHDPARVLAECAAKRRLVAEYEDAARMRDLATLDPARWFAFQTAVTALYPGLALFAAAYAEHPDYQEGWRP